MEAGARPGGWLQALAGLEPEQGRDASLVLFHGRSPDHTTRASAFFPEVAPLQPSRGGCLLALGKPFSGSSSPPALGQVQQRTGCPQVLSYPGVRWDWNA